jgi:hypothetical protein
MTADQIRALTGSQTHYNYSALCNCADDAVSRYLAGSRQQFGNKAGAWDKTTNSEWLARLYLSLKLMLSSQLLVSSLKYSENQNLQLVCPYLSYYTLLNCCRALLFTLPSVQWRDGMLRESTHSKIINETVNDLRRLSGDESARIHDLLNTGKSVRELFSYHFPATGIKVAKSRLQFEDVHQAATFLCDLAQANSECLASALAKRGVSQYGVDLSTLREICQFEAPSIVVDQDDWYRTNYLARNAPVPIPLNLMATDGLIEDFFGAWTPNDGEEPTDEQFDPDSYYCGLIFDYTY